MSCPRCAEDTAPGANFCRACGARLGRACPSCRHVNLPDSRFCTACGVALPEASPSVAPAVYTPRQLASRILTSRTAMEGERKHVTILFADLKGSMELLGDLDPEEARKLLDP